MSQPDWNASAIGRHQPHLQSLGLPETGPDLRGEQCRFRLFYTRPMLKHVSFVTGNADAVAAFYASLGATVSKDILTAEGFRRLVLTFEGGGKLQFFGLPGPEQPTRSSDPDRPARDVPEKPIQTNLKDLHDRPAAASRLLHPEQAHAAEQPEHAWMEHVALYLPDLKASVAQLRAQGVTFARELTLSPSGHPMAFVIDPDGRQVELLESEH